MSLFWWFRKPTKPTMFTPVIRGGTAEHCVHWSDGEACCRCGEPACPFCDENGCIDDARCPEWGKTYAQAAACVPVIAGASGSGKSLVAGADGRTLHPQTPRQSGADSRCRAICRAVNGSVALIP